MWHEYLHLNPVHPHDRVSLWARTKLGDERPVDLAAQLGY
jgi:hypothetical protein